MTTTWKSGDEKSTNQKSAKQATNNNTISGTSLTSWSRQQKFAMIASFGLLSVLLAISACSKGSPKPALVGVSSSAPAAAASAPTATQAAVAPASTAPAVPAPAKKKTVKKRPANVQYSDANSGVSFLYPRKFSLSSGDNAQPQFAGVDVPMNFVQPGGVTVATVELPDGSYPGTDFTTAFFNVSVNRTLSEQECSRFAFVDTSNPDGEPVDAEKVKVGSTEMEKTSDFSANAIKQDETQYYHNYVNGACYEYTLGLSTEGFGTEGIQPVDRDEVFAKLEKILTTVKVSPVEPQPVAEQIGGMTSGKE
jgi:hypothetical protein